MADIFQGLNIKFGWIWAKHPKTIQTLAQTLEDALAKFNQRFARDPDFAIVCSSDILENTEFEKFKFPILKSRYVLKNTVLLGVEDDKV
jgi:hypothetical protein